MSEQDNFDNHAGLAHRENGSSSFSPSPPPPPKNNIIKKLFWGIGGAGILAGVVILAYSSGQHTKVEDNSQANLVEPTKKMATGEIPITPDFSHPLFKIQTKPNVVQETGALQGYILYAKTISTKILSNTADEVIIQASYLIGEAPIDSNSSQVTWENSPVTVQIQCSYSHPMVDGNRLDFKNSSVMSDAEIGNTNFYFRYCHSYLAGYDTGIEKFGYSHPHQQEQLPAVTLQSTHTDVHVVKALGEIEVSEDAEAIFLTTNIGNIAFYAVNISPEQYNMLANMKEGKCLSIQTSASLIPDENGYISLDQFVLKQVNQC